MKLVQKICISLETKSNFPKEDQTEDVTAPNNFSRHRISKKSTFVCSKVPWIWQISKVREWPWRKKVIYPIAMAREGSALKFKFSNHHNHEHYRWKPKPLNPKQPYDPNCRKKEKYFSIPKHPYYRMFFYLHF